MFAYKRWWRRWRQELEKNNYHNIEIQKKQNGGNDYEV